MSATEWKPGDVAMLTNNGVDHLALRTIYGWVVPAASGYRDTNQGFDAARPLVVLDPESAEDSTRLAEALYLAGMVGAGNADGEYRTGVADRVQAALRELANPTPPKPDEPTGLGAVVEDNEGCLWFRMTVKNQTWPGEVWQEQYGAADRWSKWDDIDAVRVLSEGVSE